MWPWPYYPISLSLGFLICKMGGNNVEDYKEKSMLITYKSLIWGKYWANVISNDNSSVAFLSTKCLHAILYYTTFSHAVPYFRTYFSPLFTWFALVYPLINSGVISFKELYTNLSIGLNALRIPSLFPHCLLYIMLNYLLWVCLSPTRL